MNSDCNISFEVLKRNLLKHLFTSDNAFSVATRMQWVTAAVISSTSFFKAGVNVLTGKCTLGLIRTVAARPMLGPKLIAQSLFAN